MAVQAKQYFCVTTYNEQAIPRIALTATHISELMSDDMVDSPTNPAFKVWHGPKASEYRGFVMHGTGALL